MKDDSIFIVMGVSGSGKTTVGRLLAQATGGELLDADDFHTPENKAKMHAGIPLTDDERPAALGGRENRAGTGLPRLLGAQARLPGPARGRVAARQIYLSQGDV